MDWCPMSQVWQQGHGNNSQCDAKIELVPRVRLCMVVVGGSRITARFNASRSGEQ